MVILRRLRPRPGAGAARREPARRARHRGPVLRVLGGPGTGLSTVAVELVAERVEQGDAAPTAASCSTPTRARGRAARAVTARLGGTTTKSLARTHQSLRLRHPARSGGAGRRPPAAPAQRPRAGRHPRRAARRARGGGGAGPAVARVAAPGAAHPHLPQRAARPADAGRRAGPGPRRPRPARRRTTTGPSGSRPRTCCASTTRSPPCRPPGAFDPAWILGAAADHLEADPRRSTGCARGLRLVVVDDAQELTPAAPAAAPASSPAVASTSCCSATPTPPPRPSAAPTRASRLRLTDLASAATRRRDARPCCSDARTGAAGPAARRRRTGWRARIGASAGVRRAHRRRGRRPRRPRRGAPAAHRGPGGRHVAGRLRAGPTCSTACPGRGWRSSCAAAGRTATLRRVLRRPGCRSTPPPPRPRCATRRPCAPPPRTLAALAPSAAAPSSSTRPSRRPVLSPGRRRRRGACAGCGGCCGASSSTTAGGGPATCCSPRLLLSPRPPAAGPEAAPPAERTPRPSRRRSTAPGDDGVAAGVEVGALADVERQRPGRSVARHGARRRPAGAVGPTATSTPCSASSTPPPASSTGCPAPRPPTSSTTCWARTCPGDTLVARAPAGESVALVTPAASAGLEWDLVVVAGVQEGVWPDLRLRGSLLGSTDLVDVCHRPVAATRAPRGPQVRHDETRLFHVAVTRARRAARRHRRAQRGRAALAVSSTSSTRCRTHGPLTDVARPLTPARPRRRAAARGRRARPAASPRRGRHRSRHACGTAGAAAPTRPSGGPCATSATTGPVRAAGRAGAGLAVDDRPLRRVPPPVGAAGRRRRRAVDGRPGHRHARARDRPRPRRHRRAPTLRRRARAPLGTAGARRRAGSAGATSAGRTA